MFNEIKEKIQSVSGIRNMSKEELYYAWKWLEEGRFDNLELSDECVSELSTWCCMCL